MVSGASGAARSQKAQYWKGPNTIGTRERAWQKRQRRVETCNAGRAGAHRPSEALHPTRSLDLLPRIARERRPYRRNGERAKRQTPNAERQTPNVKRQTPNAKRRTPNPKRQTPNAERRTPNA